MTTRCSRYILTRTPLQTTKATQLVWLRSDLRVHDNAALASAMAAGPTIACFVLSAKQWRDHDVGNARIAFLLRTLKELSADLAKLRVPLKILRAPLFADVPRVLARFVKKHAIAGVHFSAEYPLNERKRDSKTTRELEALGCMVSVFESTVIRSPGTVLTGNNEPYTVFSPFKRRWLAELGSGLDEVALPSAQKSTGIDADAIPGSVDGASAALFAELWPGGERVALARMTAFCTEAVADYHAARDLPALPGTSSLSPYLSVGALSPRRCFSAAGVAGAADYAALDEGPANWLSELIWREFYRHVIAQFPHVSQLLPFKRAMAPVPWRYDTKDFSAWCTGNTGYPIVDAAQRQLLATGWMHNRLRMITAMFLTKHLLIDWRWGERHFMQHLVDGDFASNNGGWQWSASTGTDAAPYFRIFNPITQAKRFDGEGQFIKHYVPELAGLSGKALLEPWTVTGHDYPPLIVDHKFARERALAAFKI